VRFGSCDKRVIERLTKECLRDGEAMTRQAAGLSRGQSMTHQPVLQKFIERAVEEHVRRWQGPDRVVLIDGRALARRVAVDVFERLARERLRVVPAVEWPKRSENGD
jgi:hypothetical protein